MHTFVQAFIQAFFAIFQTSAFIGFMAVAFTVFTWVITCSLAYNLGKGGAYHGD